MITTAREMMVNEWVMQSCHLNNKSSWHTTLHWVRITELPLSSTTLHWWMSTWEKEICQDEKYCQRDPKRWKAKSLEPWRARQAWIHYLQIPTKSPNMDFGFTHTYFEGFVIDTADYGTYNVGFVPCNTIHQGRQPSYRRREIWVNIKEHNEISFTGA